MTLCDDNYIHADNLQLPQPQSKTILTAPGADGSLEDLLGNIEKEAIIKALEQARHNKTAAARLLGISFGALRYRLKKLGLD